MLRGISKKTLKNFNIGLLKDNKVNFYDDKNNRIKDKFLELKSDNFYIDSGIIFPIVDLFEGIISFNVRNLKFIKGQNIKYYLFPFEKSLYISGMDKTWKHILEEDSVFIFEGFFDFLSAYDNGIKNSVFICGKNLSKIQLGFLLSFTKNLILSFDSDEAGRKSMDKIYNFILKNTGIKTRRVLLDNFEDPNDFFMKNDKNNFLKKVV